MKILVAKHQTITKPPLSINLQRQTERSLNSLDHATDHVSDCKKTTLGGAGQSGDLNPVKAVDGSEVMNRTPQAQLRHIEVRSCSHVAARSLKKTYFHLSEVSMLRKKKLLVTKKTVRGQPDKFARALSKNCLTLYNDVPIQQLPTKCFASTFLDSLS